MWLVQCHNAQEKQQKPRELPERSLDPEDWEKYRKIAHHALDDALDYIKDVTRKRPLWRPVPEKVKNALNEPIPQKGKGLEKTYRDFRRINSSVCDWKYSSPVLGLGPRSGLATGIVSEMMSAAMNSNSWRPRSWSNLCRTPGCELVPDGYWDIQ